MLNHSGGNFLTVVRMMDYPRIPVSELNLGKFLNFMEFQSWKVNFRNEVCLRTADPQNTDELLTSRSITGRRDFTDYEMLDAMIASALKKLLNTQINFRRRVRFEEQSAQKHG